MGEAIILSADDIRNMEGFIDTMFGPETTEQDDDYFDDEFDELFIVDVIFNPPATIVFWSDGTKTVVKAQGKGKKQEKFDAEKGLAMAIVKRVSGNTGKYNDIFRTWIDA